MLPGLIDTHVHLVSGSGVMALERVVGYSPEEIEVVIEAWSASRRWCDCGPGPDDGHFELVERRDAQRQVDDGPWIGRAPGWLAGQTLLSPDDH